DEQEANKDSDKPVVHSNFIVIQRMAQVWKALKPEEQKEYQTRSQVLMDKYREEIKQYVRSGRAAVWDEHIRKEKEKLKKQNESLKKRNNFV
ncbi:MAG: hypothetical protein EZS28_055946, partial [Streblomastix strix]